MIRTVVFLLFISITMASGCARPVPTTTVYLVDVSKSISPGGSALEFRAAQALVDRMRRGDRLVVIPITGNATNDAVGHILFLYAPATRQPYDYDLVSFRKSAHQRLEVMWAGFASAPTERTDILGALAVAAEELNQAQSDGTSTPQSQLYIASDFVEDDGTYCFTDHAPASTPVAIELARRVKQEGRFTFPPALTVEMMELPSAKKGRVSRRSEGSIRAFWLEYFAPLQRQWTPIDSLLETHDPTG